MKELIVSGILGSGFHADQNKRSSILWFEAYFTRETRRIGNSRREPKKYPNIYWSKIRESEKNSRIKSNLIHFE